MLRVVLCIVVFLFVFIRQVMDEAKDNVTSLHVTDYEIISGSADCCVRRYDIRNGEMFADYVGSKY